MFWLFQTVSDRVLQYIHEQMSKLRKFGGGCFLKKELTRSKHLRQAARAARHGAAK